MAGSVYFEILDDYSALVIDARFTPIIKDTYPRCMTILSDSKNGKLRVIAPNLVNSGTSGHVIEFALSEIDAASLDANGDDIGNTDIIDSAKKLRTIFKGFLSPTSGGGGSTDAWKLGGNSTTGAESVGTTTNQDFETITNSLLRYKTLRTGEVVFGDSVAIGDATNIGSVPIAYKRFWLNNSDANGNRLVINSSAPGVVDDIGLEYQKQGTIMYKIGYWGDGAGQGYAQNYANGTSMVIGAQNNEIRFQTGGTFPVDRVCIKQSGRMGIGTNNPTALLSVNGSANNLTGTWGVFSDESLKKVTGETRNDWAKVDMLNFIDFTYHSSFLGADSEYVGKTMYGLCANEVEAIEGLDEFVKIVEITEGETWEWQQIEANGEPHYVMTNPGTKREVKSIEGIDKWLISQLVLKCRSLESEVAAIKMALNIGI